MYTKTNDTDHHLILTLRVNGCLIRACFRFHSHQIERPVVLTVVDGPHAARHSSRLLPAEARRVRQRSVGQGDGDPGPPAKVSEGNRGV